MAINITVPTPPSDPQTDEVVIDYDVDDAAVTLAMTFEYRVGAGPWNPCTESSNPLSDGTTPYHAGGTLSYAFVWDANIDLPLISALVEVRITGIGTAASTDQEIVGPFGHYNTVLSGAPYTWLGIFAANNTAPEGVFVFPNPSSNPSTVPIAIQGGTMIMQYNASDIDSDPVSVEFEYTRDGGKTWKTCVMGTGGDGNSGLVSSPSPGTAHTFAWNTGDLRSANIQLRGKLADDYAEGAYFYSETFWVENQNSKTWWVPKQVPPIIYKLDPDGIIKFWADLVEAWRIRESDDILGFEDLFDSDECPQEYLPHMAQRIGLRINQNFSEATRRRQIRQALEWYKSKGLDESVAQRFAGIGYEARVVALWTNGFTCTDVEPANPCVAAEWMPHSRVDLYALLYDLDSPIAPTDFDSLKKYFDEVRPIQVLVRDLVVGVVEIDLYPAIDDEDGLVDMVISPVATVHPCYLLYSGAVVDLGAGVVAIPGPGFQFQAGDVIDILGTAHYDGQYTVVGVTATTINITAGFIAETLVGTEIVRIAITAPLVTAYQHYPHDRLDEDSWLRLVPLSGGIAYFNGTRQAGTFGSGLHSSYGANRDPFTDENYQFGTLPEIGPPFRDGIPYGGGATYGDGSSFYEQDEGEIVAYDVFNNPVTLPGYPSPVIIV